MGPHASESEYLDTLVDQANESAKTMASFFVSTESNLPPATTGRSPLSALGETSVKSPRDSLNTRRNHENVNTEVQSADGSANNPPSSRKVRSTNRGLRGFKRTQSARKLIDTSHSQEIDQQRPLPQTPSSNQTPEQHSSKPSRRRQFQRKVPSDRSLLRRTRSESFRKQPSDGSLVRVDQKSLLGDKAEEPSGGTSPCDNSPGSLGMPNGPIGVTRVDSVPQMTAGESKDASRRTTISPDRERISSSQTDALGTTAKNRSPGRPLIAEHSNDRNARRGLDRADAASPKHLAATSRQNAVSPQDIEDNNDELARGNSLHGSSKSPRRGKSSLGVQKAFRTMSKSTRKLFRTSSSSTHETASRPSVLPHVSASTGLDSSSLHEGHSSHPSQSNPAQAEERAEPSRSDEEATRRNLLRRTPSSRFNLRPTKSLGSEDLSKMIGYVEPLRTRSHSCDNLVVDLSDESFGPKEIGYSDSSPEKKTDRSTKPKSSSKRAMKAFKNMSKSTRNMLGKPSKSGSSGGEKGLDELNNSSIHSLRSLISSQDAEQSKSDGKSLLAKSLDRWGSSHGPGRDQPKRSSTTKTTSPRLSLFSSKQPVQGNESISDMSSFSLFSTHSDDKYCALDGSMSSFAQDSDPSLLLSQEVQGTLSVSQGLSIGGESQNAPAQFRIDAPSFSCLSLSDEEMTIHEIKDDPDPGMFLDGESDDSHSHSNRRHHSAPTLLHHQMSMGNEAPIYLSEKEDICVHGSPERTVHDEDSVSTSNILSNGNSPDVLFCNIKYYSSPQRDDASASVASKASRSRHRNKSKPVLLRKNGRRPKVARAETSQRSTAETDPTSLQRERSTGSSSDRSSRNRGSSNRSVSRSRSISRSRSSSRARQENVGSEASESSNGQAQRSLSKTVKDKRDQTTRRESTKNEDSTRSYDSDEASSVRRERRSTSRSRNSKDLDDSLHRSQHRSQHRRPSRKCDPAHGYALPVDYRVKEDAVRRTKSEGLLFRKPQQPSTASAPPDGQSHTAQFV